LGERGLRVYLFERTPGGNLYREAYVGGKRATKLSLGHRDQERAEADGYKLLAKLKTREEALTEGKLTLSVLFDMYVVSPAHGAKKPSTQRDDRTRLKRLVAFVGRDRDVRSLCDSDLERFRQARLRGECRPEDRPVRARAAGMDLQSLNTMLNWATRQRDRRGRRLLESNPVRGIRFATEKNPRRPVETYDRFLKLMEVATDVDWRLPTVLSLAESIGQRITAILRLQRRDVDLGREPYGWIRFKSENQKGGMEHSAPLTEEAAAILTEHLNRLPFDPHAWLFPAARQPNQPVERTAISRKLLKAYETAGLKPPVGSLWHAWRRKWATERKGMPLTDVAAAGGWKDPRTLLEVYQQPEEGTVLEVMLRAPKLHGSQGKNGDSTPFPTPLRLVG
jgi:integrase